MKGRLEELTVGVDGSQRLTVTITDDFRDKFLSLATTEVDIAIEKHRERRSLTANSYLWLLIQKIADAITPPLPKEEAYLMMLKRYGQGGMVSIQDKFVDRFKREFKYCEEAGHSELNGKPFTHMRFWVGSSNYNSSEMATLIDGVISEAKELGIDTDTPDVVERLKAEWNTEEVI